MNQILGSIVETSRRVFREHVMMTVVAWVSVIVAVALSVGVALGGASLRATLIDNLEVAYHDVLVVRQATGLGEHCYITERTCGGQASLDPLQFIGALRVAYGADRVAGAMETRARLSTRGAAYGDVRLVAVDLPWLLLQPVTWIAGRAFSPGEMRASANVALVGRKVFDSLSALTTLPPRELVIGGRRFSIVGVVDAGATAMISLASAVVIPRPSATAWAHRASDTRMVLVGMPSGATPDAQRSDLIAALRAAGRLRPAMPLRLDVSGLKEQVGAIDGLWAKLQFALLQLSAILALAASVSVGALQYTVTAARKHELGVRRAVGARRRDLLRDGAIEAAVVASVGAVVGVALAVTVGWVVAQVEGLELANVLGAIVEGATPCVLLGGVAGAWATAVFVRKQPADLLTRSV